MTTVPASMPIRIFVDVTETLAFDLRTGIQRVVRAVTREEQIGSGRFMVEPVVAVRGRFRRLSLRGRKQLFEPEPEVLKVERPGQPTVQGTFAKLVLAPFPNLIRRLKRWRNARAVDRRLEGLWQGSAITFRHGDRVVLVDSYTLSGALFAARRAQRQGAAFVPVTHDLIPLKENAKINESSIEHFRNAVLPGMEAADAVMTVSNWCVGDLRAFGVRKPLGHFYLGYDVAEVPLDSPSIDDERWPSGLWSGAPVFLMVGTVTQHKGYDVAIDAFDRLWRMGSHARLLVIGRPGWDETLMARFYDNPQLGRHLFVMHGASDELLDTALRAATAVIQGSMIEGFGLPVIEALSRNTPVIASDIPVFREVAGSAALFYPQADSHALAAAIEKMINERNIWAARAAAFHWLSWSQARVQFAEQADRLARLSGK